MTEIALRQDAAPVQYNEDPTGGRLVAWAQAAHAANQLAKALTRTTFVPAHFKGNDGDATAAILAGDELGLSPLAALRSIYVVHGSPALYARTMVALAQSHGHEVWTEKSTDSEVVVCGRRRGSDHVERSVWTITRAQKAGYTGNKKYASNPQEMLFAKASAEIARKVAADVLAGVPFAVEDLELEDQPTVKVATKRTVKREAPAPAEPEFDPEPEPQQAQAEVMITDAQLRKMQALFSERGFKDSSDRHDFVRQVCEIEVASSRELTKEQASRVIDRLEHLDDPDPDDHEADMLALAAEAAEQEDER